MKTINLWHKKNTIIDRIKILSKQKEFVKSDFAKCLYYDLYNRIDFIQKELIEENIYFEFYDLFYFAVEQQKKDLNVSIFSDQNFKDFEVQEIDKKTKIINNIEKNYLLKEIESEKII